MKITLALFAVVALFAAFVAAQDLEDPLVYEDLSVAESRLGAGRRWGGGWGGGRRGGWGGGWGGRRGGWGGYRRGGWGGGGWGGRRW